MADYTSYELGNILKRLEKKVDAALCCCESLELKNLGLGVPIYVGRFKNHLKIRSLVAGTNINITYDSNTITFDSLAGVFNCSDLASCSTSNLPEGSNLYFTNSRAITALTGQNISIFNNDSGYIKLTDLSAGTGISYNNLTGVITNSAPDQTVVLTSGVGINITGTYPNFTIKNTDPDKIVSIGTTGTGLSVTGSYPSFTLQNTLPDQTVALSSGTGISVTGTYPNFTITNTSPSSGGTVTSVGATSPITSSGGTTPTISTSMATNRLIGRTTAGTGVMEEISVGTGLSLSSGTLSNSAPFTTPLTTKGDIYVRDTSADTRLPIGLDTQVLIADSTASTGMKWGTNTAATPTGYYGAWQDNITQTAAVSNVGYPMIFRTTDLSNGVSVVTNGTNLTRITFANTGIYNIQFSSQFQNASNSDADVTIWIRKNGTDVAGSAGFIQVPKRISAGAGNEGHIVVGWNYLLSIVAGEYYELVWSTTDAANVTMQYYAAGSPPPSTASVILTVTQQSGIMAGTGITAINSLTGAAQTLATGTTGTDFAISSSGTTHTFNLPTASSLNRGLLSTTDWSTFNGKQNALSGTGIVKSTTGTISYITDNSTNWDTAYTDRLKWDGGSTGLVAATGRTSLGATTVGDNLFTLTNPSAITFPRINADNTVSTLDAATFRTAIGAGTSSTNGTVTNVSALTLGTTGTDLSSTVATGTTTPVITLNVPTASATNRGALSSADWSTFNSKVGVIAKTTTDGTNVTGTTAETLTATLTIPANTFTTGDIIRIEVFYEFTGTTGTKTCRMYANTSASLSGASLLGTTAAAAANTRSMGVDSLMAVKSATNTRLRAVNGQTYTFTGVTTTPPSSVNINWTTTQYIVFSIQLGGGSDSGFISFASIEKL